MSSETYRVGDIVHRWKIIGHTTRKGYRKFQGQLGIVRKILPDKLVLQIISDKPYVACFSKKGWTKYPSKEDFQKMALQHSQPLIP